MPQFAYIATTMEGRVVEGSIEALSEKAAAEKIRSSGNIPIRISRPKTKRRRAIRIRSTQDVLLPFTTELSVLLNAGLPLDRSLAIVAEVSGSPEMKKTTESVLASVHDGLSFSDSLSRHPKVFTRLYVNMVRAGEASGTIGTVLDQLNEVLRVTKELRDHVVSAMIYPAILSLTGLASIILLFTFVLPKFSVIFSELGSTIPLSTRLLLSISEILVSYWWVIAALAASGWIILRRYLRSETGKYWWDGLKLKHFGDTVKKLETARFCRTLGTLLRGGVALLQALDNAKEVVGNRLIASAVEEVGKGAREGKGIAVPLAATGVFPKLAVSMIQAGEEAGQLDVMLLRVGSAYEESLKQSVKRFMSLFEPMMILGMGLVIGFIVISMLVAIFSITDLPLK